MKMEENCYYILRNGTVTRKTKKLNPKCCFGRTFMAEIRDNNPPWNGCVRTLFFADNGSSSESQPTRSQMPHDAMRRLSFLQVLYYRFKEWLDDRFRVFQRTKTSKSFKA